MSVEPEARKTQPSQLRRAKSFVRSRQRDLEDQALRLTAALPVHRLRIVALRRLGADLGADVTLYGGYEVRRPAGLRIGVRTIIGDRAVLDARGGLTIGDDVNLSTEVHIWTAQHNWRSADFDYEKKPVVIESRVWIGPRVTVLPGARIGYGARVAAGAVVSGVLEGRRLYGGIPARAIGEVTEDLDYHLPSPDQKQWWR